MQKATYSCAVTGEQCWWVQDEKDGKDCSCRQGDQEMGVGGWGSDSSATTGEVLQAACRSRRHQAGTGSMRHAVAAPKLTRVQRADGVLSSMPDAIEYAIRRIQIPRPVPSRGAPTQTNPSSAHDPFLTLQNTLLQLPPQLGRPYSWAAPGSTRPMVTVAAAL